MPAEPNIESASSSALTSIEPATRLRIEQAVRALFAGTEFHRVKLNDVARHARISLQTLYKYYGSKEILLFASIDTWLNELARWIDDVNARPDEDFRERLNRKFRTALAYFEQNPEIAQVIMTSACPVSWKAHESLCQTDLTSVFLASVREGRAEDALTHRIDEHEISDFIWGVASRQVAMWLMCGHERSLTDRADTIFEIVWRGIASDHRLRCEIDVAAYSTSSPGTL